MTVSRRMPVLPRGCVVLLALAVFLYIGHCTGLLGDIPLLHFIFQCSCPRFMENIRVKTLYSENAEIFLPACADQQPVPSPSGQKVAVIDHDHRDASYVWILETNNMIHFTYLAEEWDWGVKGWITDDLLLVRSRGAMSIVDLRAEAEYLLPERTGGCLANGEHDPTVISALMGADYVILASDEFGTFSLDNPSSSEQSFIMPYREFCLNSAGGHIQMKDLLASMNIEYENFIATDLAKADQPVWSRGDIMSFSPDGRYFDTLDGYYLSETGQKIMDRLSYGLSHWTDDGVIIKIGDYSLIDTYIMGIPITWFNVNSPYLRVRFPSDSDLPQSGTYQTLEATVSTSTQEYTWGEDPDHPPVLQSTSENIKIVVNNFYHNNYREWLFVGTLTNLGEHPINNVGVEIEFYDSSGSPIHKTSIDIVTPEITPKETAPFTLKIMGPSAVDLTEDGLSN